MSLDNYEVASPVSFHGWAGSLWCMIPINAKMEMKINGAMAAAVRSVLQADCRTSLLIWEQLPPSAARGKFGKCGLPQPATGCRTSH